MEKSLQKSDVKGRGAQQGLQHMVCPTSTSWHPVGGQSISALDHAEIEGFRVGFYPQERVVSLSLDSIDSGFSISWLFLLRDINEWLA